MFRPGSALGALLPAILLFASVGVDLHETIASKPILSAPASSGTDFPKPGPRRYPPGYRSAREALPPINPQALLPR
jgi:hypothetical protein